MNTRVELSIAVALAVFFASAQLEAEPNFPITQDGVLTGQAFFHDLQEIDQGHANFAGGFALGYLWFVQENLDGSVFCMPLTTKQEQIWRVVYNYFQKHPEKWDQLAGPLVTAALTETWPCSTGK